MAKDGRTRQTWNLFGDSAFLVVKRRRDPTFLAAKRRVLAPSSFTVWSCQSSRPCVFRAGSHVSVVSGPWRASRPAMFHVPILSLFPNTHIVSVSDTAWA